MSQPGFALCCWRDKRVQGADADAPLPPTHPHACLPAGGFLLTAWPTCLTHMLVYLQVASCRWPDHMPDPHACLPAGGFLQLA